MKRTVNCQHCGKEFETCDAWIKRGGGKFCSKSCGAKSRTGERNPKYAPKTRYTCETCGKEIEIRPSVKRRFCSLACRAIWQSKHIVGERHHAFDKVERKCVICGEVFFRSSRLAETAKVCSSECQYKYQSQFLIGENHPRWKPKESKECEFCGKVFTLRVPTNRFCSKNCQYDWRSQEMLIPGIERKYPLAFNERFKKVIRERDNHTCAICGEWGNQVHHINYIKRDTLPENCITLCHSCHGKTNHDRNYWKARLSALMEVRNG